MEDDAACWLETIDEFVGSEQRLAECSKIFGAAGFRVIWRFGVLRNEGKETQRALEFVFGDGTAKNAVVGFANKGGIVVMGRGEKSVGEGFGRIPDEGAVQEEERLV